MTTFAITEVFASIQGEGLHAGTPCVFVRFAGCNLWTGKEETRERDALRNEARCPRFCDTDFSPRLKLSTGELSELVARVAQDAGMVSIPLVVFTGGEPSLQIDGALLDSIRARTACGLMAIETNGTVHIAGDLLTRGRLDHLCMSPKCEPDRVRLRYAHEVKVVFPAYDPEAFFRELGGLMFAKHWFVQPEAVPGDVVGISTRSGERERAAAEYCIQHAPFRLSLQQHKIVGMP